MAMQYFLLVCNPVNLLGRQSDFRGARRLNITKKLKNLNVFIKLKFIKKLQVDRYLFLSLVMDLLPCLICVVSDFSVKISFVS